MKRTVGILIAVATVLATLAVVALDRSEAATSPAEGLNATERGIPAAYGSDGTGIWVSGVGTLSLSPDLALLELGVDTRAANITEANSQASAAMDAMNRGPEGKGRQGRGYPDQPVQRLSPLRICGRRGGRSSHRPGGADRIPRQEQCDRQAARPG